MEMNKIQSVNIINLKRREDLREAQTKNGWMLASVRMRLYFMMR